MFNKQHHDPAFKDTTTSHPNRKQELLVILEYTPQFLSIRLVEWNDRFDFHTFGTLRSKDKQISVKQRGPWEK